LCFFDFSIHFIGGKPNEKVPSEKYITKEIKRQKEHLEPSMHPIPVLWPFNFYTKLSLFLTFLGRICK